VDEAARPPRHREVSGGPPRRPCAQRSERVIHPRARVPSARCHHRRTQTPSSDPQRPPRPPVDTRGGRGCRFTWLSAHARRDGPCVQARKRGVGRVQLSRPVFERSSMPSTVPSCCGVSQTTRCQSRRSTWVKCAQICRGSRHKSRATARAKKRSWASNLHIKDDAAHAHTCPRTRPSVALHSAEVTCLHMQL